MRRKRGGAINEMIHADKPHTPTEVWSEDFYDLILEQISA